MKTFLRLFARLFDIDSPIGRCEMWVSWLISSILVLFVFLYNEYYCFFYYSKTLSVDISILIIPILIFYVLFSYLHIRKLLVNSTNKKIIIKNLLINTVVFIVIICICMFLLNNIFESPIYLDSDYIYYLLPISILWFILALFRRITSVFGRDYIIKDFLKISILWTTFLIFINSVYLDTIEIKNYLHCKYIICCVFLVFILFYILRFLIVAIFFKEKTELIQKELLGKKKLINKLKKNFISFWTGMGLFIYKIFDFKNIRGRSEFFTVGIISFIIMISIFLNGNYNFILLSYDIQKCVNDIFNVDYKGIFIILGILVLCSSLYVGRLRSLKLSPWYIFGFLIFPLNIVLMLYCLLGENKKQ